jgi:hypothetical protein
MLSPLCRWGKIARAWLNLVALLSEMLLIFGQSELVEELRLVKLEPKVFWAKEEVQKCRFEIGCGLI